MEKNTIPKYIPRHVLIPAIALVGFLASCSPSSARHEVHYATAAITPQSVDNVMPYVYNLAPRPPDTPGGKIVSYCGGMAIRLDSREQGKTALSMQPQLRPPLDNKNILVLGAITANTDNPAQKASKTFNLKSASSVSLDSEATSFTVESAVNEGVNGGEYEWRRDSRGEHITDTLVNVCPTTVITIINQNTVSLAVPDNWEGTLPPFITSRLHPRS